MEAYDTLMRSMGQYKVGRSMSVDYHDFGNGTMILVFDFSFHFVSGLFLFQHRSECLLKPALLLV